MHKVLIVDDDLAFAQILQQILEEQGYEVKTAVDGNDGYFNYLLFKPDLVITDIQMPRCNGLQLMRYIRTHDPRIRTIYMSADLSRFKTLLDEERHRYNANMLPKPFSKFDLMRLLPQAQA
ncbi:MAG TPA: response regulator [Verrucomicrobiae bacterium]|jgi:CheY-like chemotaxis protein|nr:response regulator [Verrucomicrobiae bacterium]